MGRDRSLCYGWTLVWGSNDVGLLDPEEEGTIRVTWRVKGEGKPPFSDFATQEHFGGGGMATELKGATKKYKYFLNSHLSAVKTYR